MLSDEVKARVLGHCVQMRTLSLTHPTPKAAAYYGEMARDFEAVMDHLAGVEEEADQLRGLVDAWREEVAGQ